MISESTVQRVKDLSAVDVLGKYVKLQRQGANFVCCCPFHGEKTPSQVLSRIVFHMSIPGATPKLTRSERESSSFPSEE